MAEVTQFDPKNTIIEKDNGIESLILGAGGNLLISCQVRNVLRNLLFSIMFTFDKHTLFVSIFQYPAACGGVIHLTIAGEKIVRKLVAFRRLFKNIKCN